MPDVDAILTDPIKPGPFSVGRLGALDSFMVGAECDRAHRGINRVGKCREPLAEQMLKRHPGIGDFAQSTMCNFESIVNVCELTDFMAGSVIDAKANREAA